MITVQHTQERLCAAYIEAIAGAAGVNLLGTRRNDYGIDGTFMPVVLRGNRRIESGFPIDFQAKSTTNWEHKEESVVYDLEVKTYNDLVTRHPEATPCLLLLLCLPKDQTEWISSVEDGLLLRRCCYWSFLSGEESDNAETKRIFVPRANLLTSAAVGALLDGERTRRMGA